jgi:hypothetical protein
VRSCKKQTACTLRKATRLIVYCLHIRSAVISHALVVAPSCVGCEQNLAELEQARASIVQLEQRVIELDAECMQLRTQLHEAAKLIKLQEADLERYKKAYETCRPNHPERVPREQLQLAFTRVLEFLGVATVPASVTWTGWFRLPRGTGRRAATSCGAERRWRSGADRRGVGVPRAA